MIRPGDRREGLLAPSVVSGRDAATVTPEPGTGAELPEAFQQTARTADTLEVDVATSHEAHSKSGHAVYCAMSAG